MRAFSWIDGACAVALALAALTLLGALGRQLPLQLFERRNMDAWFQADVPRVLGNMVDRRTTHFRTKVHPVASIAVHPWVTALRAVWPGTEAQAAMRFMMLVGAVWVAGVYALGRLVGCGPPSALCWGLLGLASAAFHFWFVVPETFAMGSLTLLVVLLVAALAVRRPVSDRLLIAASAVSLSMTVTNWVAGLVLAAAQRPWRRALRISAIALAIVAALAVLQRLLYSFSKLFFLGSREELDYISAPTLVDLGHRVAALLWYPISVPAVQGLPPETGTLPTLSLQAVPVLGAGWLHPLALLVWSLLFAAGAWGLVRAAGWARFAVVLGVTLGTQVVMHLIYGDETFLYAAHLLVLLLAVAMFAGRSPLGRFAPALALALAVLCFLNNGQAFDGAVALLADAVVPAPAPPTQ